MPIIFRQASSDVQLGLWKIDEDVSFFEQKIAYRSTAGHDQKKLQQLASRMLLQELHGNFPFEQVRLNAHGKPILESLSSHFSLSHCRGYAAAVLSEKAEAGIDVEEISDRVLKIEKRFLHQSELDRLFSDGHMQRAVISTLCWSIKETVFKWWGKGGVDFSENIIIQSLNGDEKGTARVSFSLGSLPFLEVHYARHGQLWLTHLCVHHFNPA